MNDTQATELLQISRDIRALIQLGMREELEEIRTKVFDNEALQMKAYRMLHEGKSYREIGEVVGVSHTTVGRWVESWRAAHLVHPTELRCVVTPDVLGIG